MSTKQLDPARSAVLLNGGLELAINRGDNRPPKDSVRDAMPRLLATMAEVGGGGGVPCWRLSTQVYRNTHKHHSCGYNFKCKGLWV